MVRIMKADSQIQLDVLEELRLDMRILATDVGVEVDKGVVTLTGTVSSYAKKVAAREAAHRVAGVLDVVDDLQVRIPNSLERTDTDIAQAVRQALIWDVYVPEERIQTTVSDGWVTLDGDVESWSQRNAAEDAIQNLMGVRGVMNRLTVNAPAVDAEDLRAAIENALERRAEREADRIRIAVDKGHVTLTGRVQSWAERQAIQGTVAGTRGVRQVENHLQVGMVG
jgi:osmotically-inducible protein OsmY